MRRGEWSLNSADERADIIDPQLRLFERRKVTPTRHRRELHDVVSGFSRLARLASTVGYSEARQYETCL